MVGLIGAYAAVKGALPAECIGEVSAILTTAPASRHCDVLSAQVPAMSGSVTTGGAPARELAGLLSL